MAILVLAPHVDDEVLGCFSFLGTDTHVVYGGIEDRPSVEVRMAERDESAAALGFSHETLEQAVNHYDANELIGLFERCIATKTPHTVLFPVASYNQDHRAFHDAAVIATRPHDSNHRVDRVLLYEQPHSFLWPRTSPNQEPNLFVPIDVDEKLTAYRRYRSQVRGHRSEEVVRALAVLRGASIGEPAAEAFYIKRQV